jgi:hypothetical protein
MRRWNVFFKDKYQRVRGGIVKLADKAVEHGQKKRKPDVPKIIKLLFVPLMVFLIAFAVYQCAKHVTVGMNTLRTQEITDSSYVSFDLYVFRDETTVPSDAGGIVYYNFSDGKKIGVGDIVGKVYGTSGLTADEVKDKQNTLNSLLSRIETLENNGAGSVSDTQSTSSRIDKSYTELINAAYSGRMDIASGYAKDMLDEMERYAALTGKLESSGVTAGMLRATADALLADSTFAYDLTTENSGYFYRSVDGCEHIFDYSSALTMSIDEFLAMCEGASTQKVNTDGYYGKFVSSPLWYAATYVSFADAAGFKIGREYVMQLSDSAYSEIPMQLERSVQDANGVMLVFSSLSVPSNITLGRTVHVRTVSESIHGYRVPESALISLSHGDETYDAVYVLEGNVVECRIVHILRRYNGYCIVKTAENAKADEELLGENTSPWERLAQNDKIITSGSGLYEGKIIS